MEKNNIIQVSGGTGADISGEFDSLYMDNILELQPLVPTTITFSLGGNPPDEVMKLSKEGFFWRGKLVADDKEIYLRFKEWLDSAHILMKGKPEPLDFNSIEERDNVIALMQEALKFYEEMGNYIPTSHKNLLNDRYLTNVEIDRGFQAGFALKRVNELREANEKIQEEYDKLIQETEDFYDMGEPNPIDLIKVFDITHKEEDNLTKMRRQGNENPIV